MSSWYEPYLNCHSMTSAHEKFVLDLLNELVRTARAESLIHLLMLMYLIVFEHLHLPIG